MSGFTESRKVTLVEFTERSLTVVDGPEELRVKRHCAASLLVQLDQADETLLATLDRDLVASAETNERRREADRLAGVAERRERRLKHSVLPDLAKTIRSLFMATKHRTVLPLDEVISKAVYTLGCRVSGRQVVSELLVKLCQLLPQWCEIFTVGELPFLRLLPTETSFHALLALLQQRLEEEEASPVPAESA
jgi:hypothetical protein